MQMKILFSTKFLANYPMKFIQKLLTKLNFMILAVGIGACVQAAAITNKPNTPPIYVRNVTAQTIGILSLDDGHFSCIPVIERNMTIPITETREATTNYDNQDNAELVIYEGEQNEIDQNNTLGSFYLDGITPSAKGIFLYFYSFSLIDVFFKIVLIYI